MCTLFRQTTYKFKTINKFLKNLYRTCIPDIFFSIIPLLVWYKKQQKFEKLKTVRYEINNGLKDSGKQICNWRLQSVIVFTLLSIAWKVFPQSTYASINKHDPELFNASLLRIWLLSKVFRKSFPMKNNYANKIRLFSPFK